MPDNQSNINQQITYTRVGLATDPLIDQVQKGYVTDCLNGIISSFDGKSVSYQNEGGSLFCLEAPVGYKVIGRQYIPQLSEVVYMLTNPTTGNSMVGYVLNNNCIFNILLDDTIAGSDLLKFNINNPILKIEVKTTNCATQLYFTDGVNPRRYIDLNNLPWKDTIVGGIVTPIVGQIDANKLKVQPNFSVMTITPTVVNVGGNIIEGSYQFAACYSDLYSNKLTSFYSITNPVSIFNNGAVSPNFNDLSNKSISITLDKLDTTGLYDYFNLAVIKTINGVVTVDFVGTFNIQSSTYNYTYTGNEASGSNIKLTITDIEEQFAYYDTAQTLCQVEDELVWGNLTKEDPLNYQKIWNQVSIGWETWKVPLTSTEDYSNGIDSAILKGYMRDEVYAIEGCFVLDNGSITPRCSIPGRVALPSDLVPITTSNPDVEGFVNSSCTTIPPTVPTWQVYNTGSLEGFSPDYNPDYNCPQPYQQGQMAYYESIKKYPNNPNIWGDLANQPIRHHRFPDSTITHIHDQNPNPFNSSYNSYTHNIYPIGIKVDVNSLMLAIQNSTDLTEEQKSHIVGFKIMRGNRVGNEGIIAKGYLYNCGQYEKQEQNFFYPNYPFNDVNPDPFISSTPVSNKSGANTSTLLNNFQQSRFTFHSPDTHFDTPNGILGSYLKLETVETGTCKAHFVQVLQNAREKIRTKYALEIAFITAILASIGVQFNFNNTIQAGTVDTDSQTYSATPTFDMQNFFPTYNTTLDLLDKLSPWINYGWQYNGIGYYGNYTPVPNLGNKIRSIDYGGYITSGVNSTFGDIYPINNTNRESSVYISVNSSLPYAGVDNSRQTASMAGVCNSSTPFYSDISAYYSSIKRYVPDQYGDIFSYTAIDTGTYETFLDNNGNTITSVPTVFGGDTFINRFGWKIKQPFYNINSVNEQDGYDVNYNQDPDPANPSQDYTNTGNIGYPIWYYSTDNVTSTIENTFGPGLTNLTNLFNTPGGLLVLVFTGGIALFAVVFQLMAELLNGAFFNGLGLKVTNLECNNYSSLELWETGMAYLYAYGIPYAFCESQVNVDMRLATNMKEGNFYPQVGTDIPDYWLQQTNVPIIYDNTYNYNNSYSKQNEETYFSLLRPDWEPDQVCYTTYPNTAIWSDQSSLEETKNNWLVYRPANIKHFPKTFGELQALDTLENKEVLVRYDNHSQIYNALATVVTSQLTASLGTGELFSGVPIDLKRTDNGYAGTQNKFIINTENGHIFVDAKRGQVLLLRGNSVEDLADAKYMNSKFFTNNLPFNILKTFPNANIDNNYNGIGLHGTYDSFYHRFILTKIDYTVINNNLKYDGTNFYIGGGNFTEGSHQSGVIKYQPKTIIELGDPNYFCNKSWTMSFSFLTNSWTSYHSYIPNFYVEYEDYFQAGLNLDSNSNNNCTIYDHNSTFTLFNSFFGVSYPYIIEEPYSYKFQNEIIQSVKDYCTVLKYNSYDQFVETNDPIYYDNIIVYNNNQNSGLRPLIVKDNNNQQQYRQYPQYNSDNVSILVTKNENYYMYNMVWDVTKDFTVPNWLNTCTPSLGQKSLNQDNMNYTNQSYKKFYLRAKDSKIRSTLLKTDYKIISRFKLQQTQNSY